MKFELIISNPPYNKNVDLAILRDIYKLGDKFCFIHPSAWLLFRHSRFDQFKQEVNVKSIELYDAVRLFNISIGSPAAIVIYDKKHNGSIEITDFSNLYKNNNIHYYAKNIEEVCIYGNDKIILNIREKIKKYTENNNIHKLFSKKEGEYNLYLPIGDRIPNRNKWVHFVFGEHNKNIKVNKHSFVLFFDTCNEVDNAYDYLSSSFAKFCNSLTKCGMKITFSSIPAFDFKEKFNEENVMKILGLTDEEIKYIKDKNL